MVDELGAVPSVNERINVKVTVEDRFSEVCDSNINGAVSAMVTVEDRFSEVCDSNINGAVSADEIGRQKTFDEGRS